MDINKFLKAWGESRNGCNEFFRHPLGRALRYSDGVQEIAEAGCYWLLDIVATEIVDVFRHAREDDRRAVFYAKVQNRKADLRLEFVEGVVVWKRHITYTDMPDGEWSFLLVNEGTPPVLDLAMILPSEH